ncbi:MAG: hypothetical protein WBR29_03410 [Gammaproteobacteria bacterium]
MKYSDHIDPAAVSLFHGHIGNFPVSPDDNKIAFVSDGYLFIVTNDKPVAIRIVVTNSIWKKSKPIGEQFYREDDFQWSRNSKVLYLIKDKYYRSNGVQLFSPDGELWSYDLDSGALRMVLKPFPAFEYFLDVKSGIYFSIPNESGDLQLEYFNGHKVVKVGEPESTHKAVEYIDVMSPFA